MRYEVAGWRIAITSVEQTGRDRLRQHYFKLSMDAYNGDIGAANLLSCSSKSKDIKEDVKLSKSKYMSGEFIEELYEYVACILLYPVLVWFDAVEFIVTCVNYLDMWKGRRCPPSIKRTFSFYSTSKKPKWQWRQLHCTIQSKIPATYSYNSSMNLPYMYFNFESLTSFWCLLTELTSPS